MICFLDIIVKVYKGDSYAIVRIANAHSNVVYIEKDGDVLLDNGVVQQMQEDVPDYSLLSVQGIYDFAQTVDIEDVKEVLDRQIEYNSAIAEEGLKNNYGCKYRLCIVRNVWR